MNAPIRVEAGRRLPVPLRDGFDYITDPANWPEYWPRLITVDPAPLGVEGRTARGLLFAAGVVLDCCALPHGQARGLRLGLKSRQP